VRLWVLAVFVPAFIASTWLQMAGRGIMNHPPDSRYYLTMMLRDTGHPLGDALRREHGVSRRGPSRRGTSRTPTRRGRW